MRLNTLKSARIKISPQKKLFFKHFKKKCFFLFPCSCIKNMSPQNFLNSPCACAQKWRQTRRDVKQSKSKSSQETIIAKFYMKYLIHIRLQTISFLFLSFQAYHIVPYLSNFLIFSPCLSLFLYTRSLVTHNSTFVWISFSDTVLYIKKN